MKFGRVLLADSHLSLLQGIHSLLNALFEITVMVADERSLFEAVSVFNPALAVVDLSMPSEDRENVACRLMERHPELNLIVLSVHDDPTVVTFIRNSGAAGFVLKRNTASELAPAIEAVLKGGTYISPELVPLTNDRGIANQENSRPEEEQP
jgi:two-component system response regulator DegU